MNTKPENPEEELNSILMNLPEPGQHKRDTSKRIYHKDSVDPNVLAGNPDNSPNFDKIAEMFAGALHQRN